VPEGEHVTVGERGDPVERARGFVLEQVLVDHAWRAVDNPKKLD
jgi:hypothetical protein